MAPLVALSIAIITFMKKDYDMLIFVWVNGIELSQAEVELYCLLSLKAPRTC